MKKIVISQPWASLVLSGLVDVFDLGIDLGTGPCLVLIQAAPWQKYDNSPKTPLEWLQALEMAQLMGIVPLYHEMPFDCIIGYVIVVDVSKGSDSIWAYGSKKNTLYRLFLPLFFDKPFSTGAELSEEDLMRASVVFPTPPCVIHGNLSINVNRKLFYDATEGFSFTVPITDDMFKMLIHDGAIIPYKSIMLHHAGMMKRFAFEKDNDFDVARDEKGKPKHFFSIRKGKDDAKPFFRINLRHKMY